MIRNISPKDLQKFNNIKIISHTKSNNITKEYLLIERPPFISAFICINDSYTILIEQFRPVIGQNTIEIPMGKIESYDCSPKQAMIRELQEECCLFLNTQQPYLLLEDKNTKKQQQLFFDSYTIIEDKSLFVSPGFSTSQQFPFTIYLSTLQPLHNISDHYQMLSQESDLTVYCKKITEELIEGLDGLSRYHLIQYLYKRNQ